MAETTVTLFQNKSSKQATDYSFGMSLSEVSTLIDNALPERARITALELQLSCRASVSLGYANVNTYVSLCDSDSNANSSSKATILISKSYKTTDGTQTGTYNLLGAFFPFDPYEKRNTSYSRIAVYFDTSNITQKTFTCDYLRLKITYDNYYLTRFYNYDGTFIRQHEIKEGEKAYYNVEVAGTPTRPSDEQYDYVFSGWTPPFEPITKDTTYTAVYTAVPRKINNISVDTSPSAIVWADTVEPSEITADTTKVYG